MQTFFTRVFILSILLQSASSVISATGIELHNYSQANDKVPAADFLDRLAQSQGISIVYDSDKLADLLVAEVSSSTSIDQAKQLLAAAQMKLVEIDTKSYVIRLDNSKPKVQKPKDVKISVSGVVLDKNRGESLIGVSILSKDTGAGTTTDIDGKFTLEVDEGEELLFSYIGYTSITKIAVSEPMTVYMEEAAEQLDCYRTRTGDPRKIRRCVCDSK